MSSQIELKVGMVVNTTMDLPIGTRIVNYPRDDWGEEFTIIEFVKANESPREKSSLRDKQPYPWVNLRDNSERTRWCKASTDVLMEITFLPVVVKEPEVILLRRFRDL